MVTQNSDGDANVWRSMVRLSPMIMQKFDGTEENVSLKTSIYVNAKKLMDHRTLVCHTIELKHRL